MSAIIVNRGEYFDDSSSKNKWRWEWTDKLVKVQSVSDEEKEKFERIGQHIRKVDVVGRARCVLCLAEIVYNFRGCVALTEHLTTKKHRERC